MTEFEHARVELINLWKQECIENSEKHNKKAITNKKKFQIFGMLNLIIPIGFTLANQVLGTPGPVTTLSSIGFASTAIVSVILNFLNFKVLATKHDFASIQYHSVENEIDSIMVDHLSPPDVLIEKVKTQIKLLEVYSPDLNRGVFSCSS